MTRRCPLLLLAVFGFAATVGAQEQQEPDPTKHPLEGKTVQRIAIEGKIGAADRYSGYLVTKVGNPLRAADLITDERTLWRDLKLIPLQVLLDETEDGGVVVTFVIEDPPSFDRLEFRGLEHFTEQQARAVLGITPVSRITDLLALEHARDLEARYRTDGYHFARVTLERDEEASVLTMVVDEGPEVTIGEVRFRGNRAFPGWAPLGLYRNLIGSSDIESGPGWFLSSGDPYNEEAVESDLEKLRVFYRGLGYRDAQVELAERTFRAERDDVDFSTVDLTFRVIEGRRYRIRSVDLERVLPTGEPDPDPLYPKEELLEDIRAKPGMFYDRELVNRDKRAIQRFYGKRGHPLAGQFDRGDIPDALQWYRDWLQPVERFDPETAEIDLIYQIIEGSPKQLRDVVIRGNTDTQDRVVRRRVFAYPGETLDITEVERSRSLLDSLSYFQDPESLVGVKFQLAPAEAANEVDLEIHVQEGDTGSFLWGAGVSTGLGVQGRLQFNKRNFDLFRLPSSANPVTVISEILDQKAFHGAGQELQLFISPGTELSSFTVSIDEPDLFGQHIDTIGARAQAYRRLRLLRSYDSDRRGVILGLHRNFSEEWQVGVSVRQETVQVEDVDPNAPEIVFDAEGQTEIRSLELQARWRDLDNYTSPTDGHDFGVSADIAGGLLGAEEDFYKLGVSGRYYYPLYVDSLDRAHVLYVEQSLEYGHAYGNTDDLFLTERFHMGGSNLRGFDQRRAGPTQFGRPLGGEAMYLSEIEYRFPLVSTRIGNSLRQIELLRGVVFCDAGLLGTQIDDPTFRELRLSVGVGVRILVPYLNLPIGLDLALPLLYEETDDRRPFYFELRRN